MPPTPSAARDHRDIQGSAFPQTHNGAFAELLFDLGQGQAERPLFFFADVTQGLLYHDPSPFV
jgi:hypothetical protein